MSEEATMERGNMWLIAVKVRKLAPEESSHQQLEDLDEEPSTSLEPPQRQATLDQGRSSSPWTLSHTAGGTPWPSVLRAFHFRLHRTNTSEGSACSSGQEGPCARSQEMPNGAHSGEEAEDVAAEQHLEQPVCG
ncbi:uncharacterized protein LOC143844223 isoform X1 [Paroedura picta]|uniref:uncharacterized protein LOC143844223 isoform X1 n=1 Tax=Paroedura picta TaxID=143630 RepID=UPI004055DDB1